MASPMTNDDAQQIRAALTANSVAAPERFRALAKDFGLPEVELALDELLSGLRDVNRPQVAINLQFALRAYLEVYRAAETRAPTSHIGTYP